MSSQVRNVPIGIRVIQKLTEKCCKTSHFNRDLCFKSSVWILTFLAYTAYHASRKALSVVKTTFHHNCSDHTPPADVNETTNLYWCDWQPFDGPDSSQLLGALDSSFLFAYASAMFVSGIVAERVNLRYFLSLGMILSGLACYLLGITKIYGIHSLLYFILVQVFGGIVQTTGWPGVVAVMGNWFEKAKRGLIMGIWNSHTSIGNIVGTLVAGYYLEKDWSLSFIVPGLMIGLVGILNFLFLVVTPSDVGCTQPKRPNSRDKRLESSYLNINATGPSSSGYRPMPTAPLSPDFNDCIESDDQDERSSSESELIPQSEEVKRSRNEGHPILSSASPDQAVGFLGALTIPGVIEYSLSLFFAKLVSYTFLYWLPLYIKSSTNYSATMSADMSTWFDVGGIVGGIAAGLISDYSGMSATTCVGMLICAIPVLFVYYLYGAISMSLNMGLLFLTGILVNGPYALITTAVSAELGTHHSLAGNSRALATVTAIIDGTGSVGAALGPLFAGYISALSWEYVFYSLMVSDLCSIIFLLRICSHEISQLRSGNYPEWSP